MTVFSPIVAISGSPSIIIALVLGAIGLLELERIWTRTRRFAGRPVGAPAFVLDGLALLAALLAFVGGVLALTRMVIEVVSPIFEHTKGLIEQIDGTAAGLATGSLIALLVSMLLIRRLSSHTSAPSRESISEATASEGRSIRSAPALPVADGLPVPSGNVVEPGEEPPLVMLRTRRPPQRPVLHPAPIPTVEPPLVMLRTRRPPQRPVLHPAPIPTVEPALTPPRPGHRRLHWSAVIVATLLVFGATGFVYRDTIIQTVAAWQFPTTSLVISRPTEGSVFPTTLPAVPSVEAHTAPTPAPQLRYVVVERLNLRAGPGVGYPVITTLKRGDEVVALGETAGSGEDMWVRVRAGEQEGWVFRAFLQ